jgi:hypothetical protein
MLLRVHDMTLTDFNGGMQVTTNPWDASRVPGGPLVVLLLLFLLGSA